MRSETVYKSNFIEITKIEDDYFIQSFEKGMSIQEFNNLMLKYNNISITSFNTIKDSLLRAPKLPEKFGSEKTRVSVEISNDEMKAYVTLSIDESELRNTSKIVDEIRKKLKLEGVIFGLKLDEFISNNSFEKNKQILVAIGKNAVNGDDSIVKIKELNEIKPEDTKVGGVNHFELNIVTKVTKDAWLGEWTAPTDGTHGITVKGSTVKPIQGMKIPIKYAKNSVKEEYQDGVTRLFALKSGAFEIEDTKLFVSDILEINGDVDYTTGNIKFEGALSIKGTIKDSFSVTATKDIEILGREGLGCADKIVSTEGSIIIHGGISGKGKTFVQALKNVTLKYVSEATIVCGGCLNVESSILNSNVTARNVVIEKTDGQLIGGETKAITKIVSPKIGSISEPPTLISIEGISKDEINKQITDKSKSIQEFQSIMAKKEKEISILQNKSKPSQKDDTKLYRCRDEYYFSKSKIREFEEEVKILTKDLSIRGNGEVVGLNKIFPKVIINMCGIQKVIYSSIVNSSFYFEDEEIKEK